MLILIITFLILSPIFEANKQQYSFANATMKWAMVNQKLAYDLTNVEINGKQQDLKCVFPGRFKKFVKLEGDGPGGGNEFDELEFQAINCATTIIGKICRWSCIFGMISLKIDL